MKTLKVLMVHAPTAGLHHDAVVLADALRELVDEVEVTSLDIPWNPALDYETAAHVPSEVQAHAPFDIAFHFEHLYGHAPLRSLDFARRRVFVPNIEWLMTRDEEEVLAHRPDGILYKNRFTQDRCEQIPGVSSIGVRVLTGWTSSDFACAVPPEPRDFRSFLHVRGVSVQKNAEVLLSAWHSNPDFPPLTLIASPKNDFFASPWARSAHNIEIIAGERSAAEVRRYQHSHGIHVYPSYAEGFGHAQNEARICGAVLVTTGAPPMSDLVRGNSGFAIPVHSQDVSPLERSSKFLVQAATLASTIREVLATPISRLAQLGQTARENYVRDQLSFRSRMRDVLGSSGVACRDELPGTRNRAA